jgi:hypothetical protein
VVTRANEQSVSLEQTTADLVHLVRKFRWMGMEDEAMKVQTALARCLALHECSPSLEIYLERQEFSLKALSTERNPSGTR